MDSVAASASRAGGDRQLVVAVYGRSLLAAGVAGRLAHRARLHVVAIDGPSPAEALGSLGADALVVDLASVPLESALGLLTGRPDLLLVGLEASGARLLVLSGERAGGVGIEDLGALIERGLPGPSAGPGAAR